MIDLLNETVVSLSEAAKHPALPRRRAGKRPHVSTLHRWSTSGCRGVKLETIRFGGTLCTSLEAIQRFANCLTARDRGHESAPVVTPARRRREIERANRELDAVGIGVADVRKEARQ